MYSCKSLREVELSLSSGISIYDCDYLGETLLHKTNDLGIINTILSMKANPNVVDKRGNTPLHFAVQSNNLQKIKSIIRNSDAHPCMINDEGKRPIDYAKWGSDVYNYLYRKKCCIDE